MSFKVATLRALGCSFALVLSATSSTAQDFIAFEGKNAVREGEGGAKKTVEGVDFWSDGAPPRKYKLLGYITDRRQKSGLIGRASMASLEKDVAQVAKKNGADAVILMASDAETVGVVGTAFGQRSGSFGSGFGASAAVQKNNSKFAVLKYVIEIEPTAPAPVSPVTAPLAPTVAVDPPAQNAAPSTEPK
ncbi:MAG: hypothetical protein JWQ07_1549 [Ramlibacter sp.]|nr:hypothetical protein [Ramlibacter sp.]